jgi:hypothetical protein
MGADRNSQERAFSQLRASHETPRKPVPATFVQLTTTELRNAQLGSEGRSKQGGGTSAGSHHTAACHRAHRVAKTGVASRGALPPQPGLNPRLAVCYFIRGVVFWIAATTSRVA